MTASLEQLIQVPSQLTEAVAVYCAKVVESLDRTPWHRKGEMIRACDVAVPVRVLKESTRQDRRERDGFDERARDFDDPIREHANDRRRSESSRDYTDPEVAALYEEPTFEKRREEVPWSREQPAVRRALVLGGPGSGKSFLTQTTAMDLARAAIEAIEKQSSGVEALVVPIHLTLERFADPTLPRDPAAAALEAVRRDYAPCALFMAWLQQRFRDNSTWLILDALDEVRGDHRPVLEERLRAIETQAWQTRVLLTCRPANYSREQVPWTELTEYELAPFNPDEIRQFVRRWFGADNGRATALTQALDRNYPLSHAAHCPLLTTFLCLAHEEAPVTASTRRAELYHRVVRGLARRAWKPRPLSREDPHVDDLVRFVMSIARPLFELHPASNVFTHEEITEALTASEQLPVPWVALAAGRAEQPMPPATSWPTLLRDELIETRILVGAGLRNGIETQFSFAHRSVLEYLVARNLNQTKGGWAAISAFVDRKSWHPAWQETVVFLAGLMKDPVPLLALLADASTDDATRQRLCLAGRCLPELNARGQSLQQPSLRDIAGEIIELWCINKKRGTDFDHVTNVLPCIGVAAVRDIVPGQLTRSRSWNLRERELAVDVLRHLGAGAATPDVLGRLIECLRDPDGYVSFYATDALGVLGAAAGTPACWGS